MFPYISFFYADLYVDVVYIQEYKNHIRDKNFISIIIINKERGSEVRASE